MGVDSQPAESPANSNDVPAAASYKPDPPAADDAPLDMVAVMPADGGGDNKSRGATSSGSPTHSLTVPPAPAPPPLSRYQRVMRWDVYTRLDLLVESPWPRVTLKHLLCWKLFTALWTTATFLMALIQHKRKGKFFVYLTYWNYFTMAVYFIASAYLQVRVYRAASQPAHEHATRSADARQPPPSQQLEAMEAGQAQAQALMTTTNGAHSQAVNATATPRTQVDYSSYRPHVTTIHFVFVMHEHAFAWAGLVGIAYWAALFPAALLGRDFNTTSYEVFQTIVVHFLILPLMLVDTWLGRHEFVFSHFWLYTLPVSILYLVANGVYVAVRDETVYSLMKWEGGLTAGIVIVCFVIGLLVYMFGAWFVRKRNQRAGIEAPHTPEGASWWNFRCSQNETEEQTQAQPTQA